MRWLYIHLPSLQLDSLLYQQGCDGPCALVQQGQMVQTNASAQELGIVPGTGLAQAALLSSQLIINTYQERQEQRLLKQLALQLYQFSATLYLDPPQGLLLLTADMRLLYKDESHYWQVLQGPLQSRQLRYQVTSSLRDQR